MTVPLQEDYAYELNGQRVCRAQFYAVACDPRRSVAVEACAGAGKTWMLVSRMLRALLDGAQPHEILAITFTKKAAGEMRERLQQWLQAFADAPQERLAHELRIRGVSAQGVPAQSAALAGLYRALLQAGRPVQVRTFHSWFAALLRNAPLAVLQQLGLPARYELLEDDSEAVAAVWRRFHIATAGDAAARQDYLDAVAAHGRFTIFLDCSAMRGFDTEVRGTLRRFKSQFGDCLTVHMLMGSRLHSMLVDVARLSLGSTLVGYSSGEEFAAVLQQVRLSSAASARPTPRGPRAR